MTVNFKRRKATGSSSNPDSVKITTRAMLRSVADQYLSMWRAASIPGTFLSMKPTISIPSKLGRDRYGTSWTRNPPSDAKTTTTKIPKIFPPGKTSCPIMDQSTAHPTRTINARVRARATKPDGGIVNPNFPSAFAILNLRGEWQPAESSCGRYTFARFSDEFVRWSSPCRRTVVQSWRSFQGW